MHLTCLRWHWHCFLDLQPHRHPPSAIRHPPSAIERCAGSLARASLWSPSLNCRDPNEQVEKDLFATTGDYLRIWKIGENNQTSLECLLNNVSC